MANTRITWNGRILPSTLALELAMRKAMRDRAEEITERVAVTAAEDMRNLTPVRTGNAKSSWSVARENLHPPYDSNKIGEHPVDTSGLDATKIGDISIKNSAPHISELEFGYSLQAPAGMVRLTLARIGEIIAAAKRR